MNENIVTYSFTAGNPTEGSGLSTNALYFMIPFGATIIYVSAAPLEDDTGATVDINDDGASIIAGVDASDKDVPGEWISTHVGGTETPVAVAAGSVMDLDFNNAANANSFNVVIQMLQGSTWG
jgi:hypothetical protein